MCHYQLQVNQDLQTQLAWPDQDYKQLVIESIKSLPLTKEPTRVTCSLCHGGRSGVTVFKIVFKFHGHLDKALIIRSHSNQEAAQNERQRADELQVNSKDCFLNVCDQLPLLLANHSLVVYEDVATNLVADEIQPLCESVVDYLSATQDRETFAKNFQTFVQAITKSYEEVKAKRGEIPAGNTLFQDLSTLEELTNLTAFADHQWLTEPLRNMGFEESSILTVSDCQRLCQTLESVRTYPRHTDLHCGNVLVANNSFKLIDVGDLAMELAAADMARLEVSLWFELTQTNRFSKAEAEEIVQNLTKEKSKWQSSSPVLAFTLLLHSLRQGFRAGSALKDLPEKEIELAYLLQILRYQRYWCNDKILHISPALNVFVKSQFRPWQQRLGRLPPELPKLRACEGPELENLKQQLVLVLAVPEPPVPKVSRDNWPFPIQAALNRLRQSAAVSLQDYFNVFEAFVHFHFVALGSQFYWAVTGAPGKPDRSSRPVRFAYDPDIKAGLEVLHQTLSDAYCEGSTAWVKRNAILSKASKALPASLSLPFPELVTVQTEEVNLWLTDLAQLRKQIGNYDSLFLPEFAKPLTGLATRLRAIFQPYHGLHLAMVTEDDAGGRGVHCYWQETQFLCKTAPDNLEEMAEIWPESSPNSNVLQAPKPPRVDWQWDKSLMLCDLARPYQRYLYLMPLGAKYSHRDEQSPYPGLLDSVRWQAKDRSVVIQRHYHQDKLPPLHWQVQKSDEMGVQNQEVNKVVETLVKELFEKFDLAYPEMVTAPREANFSPFDLQHGKLALHRAAHSVLRQAEVARILEVLKHTPARRLLLEGASGSGKSVLLAQLYQQLDVPHPSPLPEGEGTLLPFSHGRLAQWYPHEETRRRVVFVSLDAGNLGVPLPSPLPEGEGTLLPSPPGRGAGGEGPKDSTGLRVAMYCVTVLTQEWLPMLLPLEDLQRKLRQVAEQRATEEWLIIIDGLNQAVDPGNITGHLPDPLPANVSVVASSQRQDRVWDAITRYGHESWERVEVEKLSEEEAQKIVHYYWTVPIPNSTAPALDALPAELVAQLVEKSQGLPVLLEGWTQRLRELWQADSARFANTALVEFQAHAHEWLPAFLQQRLKEAQQQFQPAPLLEALLWSLSLISKGLTVTNLVDCVQALRKLTELAEFAQLPPVSKSDIEEGLSKLSGFLRKTVGGEDSWQLSHELVGTWFVDYKGKREWLPKVRLSLVRLGAIPLPAKASEEEFAQWLAWMQQEDYEHYRSLPDELQISVCESLLAYLPKSHAERALVLAQLAGNFLTGTGEQPRAFALESLLEQALQQPNLPAVVQVEILCNLGDIQQALNRLDKALEYYKRYLEVGQHWQKESPTPQTQREVAVAWLRLGDLYQAKNDLDQALTCFQRTSEMLEQLHTAAPTPQTARDLALSWGWLGDLYQAKNDLDQALTCFQRSFEMREQLHTAAPTPQTQLDVAVSCNRLGVFYFNQNQFHQALPYFERDLQLSEQLLAAADIPSLRRGAEITRQWVASTREKLVAGESEVRFVNSSRVDKSKTNLKTNTREKLIGLWEKVKRWWQK